MACFAWKCIKRCWDSLGQEERGPLCVHHYHRLWSRGRLYLGIKQVDGPIIVRFLWLWYLLFVWSVTCANNCSCHALISRRLLRITEITWYFCWQSLKSTGVCIQCTQNEKQCAPNQSVAVRLKACRFPYHPTTSDALLQFLSEALVFPKILISQDTWKKNPSHNHTDIWGANSRNFGTCPTTKMNSLKAWWLR